MSIFWVILNCKCHNGLTKRQRRYVIFLNYLGANLKLALIIETEELLCILVTKYGECVIVAALNESYLHTEL